MPSTPSSIECRKFEIFFSNDHSFELGITVTASILFFGDFAPDFQQQTTLLGQGACLFADLTTVIEQSSHCIVNLEAPLCKKGEKIAKSGPSLRLHPEIAGVLKRNGVDIVSLANNHIKDFGALGISETIESCISAGVDYYGAGENSQAATTPCIKNLDGRSVALLSVAEAEFNISGENEAGAAELDIIRISRQLRALKRRCDFVILSIHGGVEHFQLPPQHLRHACHFFVEEGADAIICHHSHVPGCFEIVGNVPIFYGLGNLLMPSRPERPLWHLGYGVRLEGFQGGNLAFELIPYRYEDRTFRVKLMLGAEATKFVRGLEQFSAVMNDETHYANALATHYRTDRGKLLLLVPPLLRPIARLPVGLWLIRAFRRRDLRRKLNIIRCPSHRESLISQLEGQKDV